MQQPPMERRVFKPRLRRFVETPAIDVDVPTVRAALEAAFDRNPELRGYVLDDQAHPRANVVRLCGRQAVHDRISLSYPQTAASIVHVLQALSGGEIAIGNKTAWIAIRKGLFERQRDRAGRQIAKAHFLAAPASRVWPAVAGGRMFVALNLGHFGVKLHGSDDHGQTWQELAVPTYPLQPEPLVGPA